MERGVEDGHVRYVRQRVARTPDLLECAQVVERSEDGEFLDRLLDFVVHERRADEAASTVDDAVTDRVCCDEIVHLQGLAPRDEVKLEACGARVDNQDVDGRGFS